MKCMDASKAKKMNGFVKGIDGAMQQSMERKKCVN